MLKVETPSASELSSTHDHVSDEAYVIVKAAPRRSQKYGETVCCAAIDRNGVWVRLYPVSFRFLPDAKKFGRWDRIRYRWRRPKASQDRRGESRRIDPNSVEILGALKPTDRHLLLNRSIVLSLNRELEAKRSLALIRPEILDFWHVRRPAAEIAKAQGVLDHLRAQQDMFDAPTELLPHRPCPIEFHYRYRDADGPHVGTCQDWETETTFLRRCTDLGSEAAALEWMLRKFGEEYPRKGMALAMGTHRHHPNQWLINGVVRLDEEPQLGLF